MNVRSFNIRSINYHKEVKGMEFLYLADSLCSILDRRTKGNSNREYIKSIENIMNGLNDKDLNLLFGYDEIDLYYQRAWERYEAGDYYDALDIIYDAGLKQGDFAEFYKKRWFKHIEGLIAEDTHAYKFTQAVNKLNSSLMTNTLNQEKAVYILEALEKTFHSAEDNLKDADGRAALYRLYDIGVSAYCHIGDSRKALLYFEKCRKYAYRVSIDEYLRTMNKLTETLLDSFEWKKAKKIADDSLNYQKLLLEMKNQIPEFKTDASGYLGLSKAYSQRGQVYAFCRENSECEEMFKKALESFEPDSADYKITQSYLMHHYIDAGNKEAYVKEADSYFNGKKKFRERIEMILSDSVSEAPLYNYKYALYVLLRGTYLFEENRISDELLDELSDIDTYIKKYVSKKGNKNGFERLTGHPTELIYKYIAMLLYNRGKIKEANKVMKKIPSAMLNVGPTIEVIMSFGSIEYLNLCRNKKERDVKSKKLFDYLKSSFRSFSKTAIPDDGDERYSALQNIVTYMYH